MTESQKPPSDEENTAIVAEPEASLVPKSETPSDDAAETATAAKEKSGGPWAALALSLVAIAVVGGGVATFDQWKGLVLPPAKAPSVASAPQSPVFRPATDTDSMRVELNGLRDRLAQLEMRPQGDDGAALAGRFDKAETAIQALQAQPQVPARLVGEVEDLGKQVAELKRTSADAAAVLRLADRVEKIDAELREVQARRSSAVAVLLAVGQLREALARAMPYDAELRALLALAGSDPEVVTIAATLKNRATVGIPTSPILISRFHRLAPDLVRAQVLPAEQSWWRQTLDRLTSLVVVRREDGDAAGTSTAAIVARAEARLAEDDLEHAAAEIISLPAVAAEIAAPWLGDVQARLIADKAASALTAHVVAQVGAKQ
ncbi:COG4223 family protein [Magnetospirillum sulfuroxidans]|uniref:Uroporphyrin-3 C-methyltransferase n=1 Tax=Magnetospirillum sulfuroxidans TaxID=611300 RepID=A0ABS5IAW4_9PROT|nr:mitofilin family membrane protein [Magnetospirillum sulfuroxidans]MBR9971567.1 hypothetical protein [Magnetospirillum sulfuroxidans]